MCSGSVPIAPSTSAQCIVGPFPVIVGPPQNLEFAVAASGKRQTSGGGEFFSPSLVPLGYQGASTSFLLVYETSIIPHEGLRIQGRASGATVEVNLTELSATISVSCSSVGGGAPFPVVAYAITTYDASGTPTGGCDSIPTVELGYTNDGRSDSSVNYSSS